MDEPVALDAGAALTRLTAAVGERILEARTLSGLSSLQLQVLRLARGGVAMSSLTTMLGIPKSTLGSVIDGLEATGLVARAIDDADRRRQLIHTTRMGAIELRLFDAEVATGLGELLEGLTPAHARRLAALMARLPEPRRPVPLVGPR